LDKIEIINYYIVKYYFREMIVVKVIILNKNKREYIGRISFMNKGK